MEEWVIELGFKASEIFPLYYPRHEEVKLGSDSGTFVGKGNRSSFPCKCVAGLEAIALCDGMFKVRSLEKRSMVIWESIVPLLFKQTTSVSRPGDICLSGLVLVI